MRIFKKEGGFYPEIPQTLAVPDELDPHSLLAKAGVAETDIEDAGVLI